MKSIAMMAPGAANKKMTLGNGKLGSPAGIT